MDESFFRDLVARSRDAIITIDSDSTVLFANDGVETVLGYDPEELEGKPLTTVMPERFQDRHHEAVRRYLRTGERTLDWDDIELPAEHADGHEVPLSITFEEHEHDGERLFSGIMRDVTYRVEREDRLERKNEQLEQFASYVSHDLRNPLNTARSTVALMRAAEGGADSEEYLADLERTLGRMEDLIEGVLTLAEGGRVVGSAEAVSLEAVAQDAWASARTEGATFDVVADTTMNADRERLQALLENLFRNAVEHGSPSSRADPDDAAEHGSTGSRTQSVDAEGAAGLRVEVGTTGDGFYVADNGTGVPAADLEGMFERGYTTSKSGTGLGLDIARTIAEAHDWTVGATEAESGGLRIEIRTG